MAVLPEYLQGKGSMSGCGTPGVDMPPFRLSVLDLFAVDPKTNGFANNLASGKLVARQARRKHDTG